MNNLPDSLKDIFDNGEEQYHFSTEESLDNIESLQYFIRHVGISCENIIEDFGTQISIEYQGKIIYLDSSGLGDFYSHCVSASYPE